MSRRHKFRAEMRIQCAKCPQFLVCTAGTRAEFGAALEERGWRPLKGAPHGRAICPKCVGLGATGEEP